MITRRRFLTLLLALPSAATIAVALSDHAELVARVDKSIIDETRKRLGMEKIIMLSNPSGHEWLRHCWEDYYREPSSWDSMQKINHHIYQLPTDHGHPLHP